MSACLLLLPYAASKMAIPSEMRAGIFRSEKPTTAMIGAVYSEVPTTAWWGC